MVHNEDFSLFNINHFTNIFKIQKRYEIAVCIGTLKCSINETIFSSVVRYYT